MDSSRALSAGASGERGRLTPWCRPTRMKPRAADQERSVEGSMKYHTTFSHLRIYIAFLSALSLGMLVIAVLVHSAIPAIGAVAVLGYLCAVRLIRSVTLTDEGFAFHGIVRHWSVDWPDIKGLKKIKEYRWPIDRIFGDGTYEIQTVHGRKIVSFFFFPGDCIRELKERIRPNPGLQADAQQASRR
jgi:hypothetical protein